MKYYVCVDKNCFVLADKTRISSYLILSDTNHCVQGTSILNIQAKDGDLGDPRNVLLTIEGDLLGYFSLVQHARSPTSAISVADLVTSNKSIDREHPDILQNGGIYAFSIKVSTYILALSILSVAKSIQLHS